jgi:hypothetical protein
MKWVISLMGCDTYGISVGQPDGTGRFGSNKGQIKNKKIKGRSNKARSKALGFGLKSIGSGPNDGSCEHGNGS